MQRFAVIFGAARFNFNVMCLSEPINSTDADTRR